MAVATNRQRAVGPAWWESGCAVCPREEVATAARRRGSTGCVRTFLGLPRVPANSVQQLRWRDSEPVCESRDGFESRIAPTAFQQGHLSAVQITLEAKSLLRETSRLALPA